MVNRVRLHFLAILAMRSSISDSSAAMLLMLSVLRFQLHAILNLLIFWIKILLILILLLLLRLIILILLIVLLIKCLFLSTIMCVVYLVGYFILSWMLVNFVILLNHIAVLVVGNQIVCLEKIFFFAKDEDVFISGHNISSCVFYRVVNIIIIFTKLLSSWFQNILNLSLQFFLFLYLFLFFVILTFTLSFSFIFF